MINKYYKKTKVAFVEANDYFKSSIVDECVKESEFHVAELKSELPYVCKSLKPSNGKILSNPVKSEKFVTKTYIFDITKCDDIFDLLVTNEQIIVPLGLKIPPLEQRKKRGFCKCHNFLGHKTSQCLNFRDLVQKALKEGSL